MKRSAAIAVAIPFPVSFPDPVTLPMLLLGILTTLVAFFHAAT